MDRSAKKQTIRTLSLSPKETITLSGALIISLHVPPVFLKFEHPSQKKELETIWEQIDKDLTNYIQRAIASNHPARAVAEMPDSTWLDLSPNQENLLRRVFKEVIEQDRPRRSHNVYFNGDQFGITLEDFECLLSRL